MFSCLGKYLGNSRIGAFDLTCSPELQAGEMGAIPKRSFVAG
jgi:hypothetical protein